MTEKALRRTTPISSALKAIAVWHSPSDSPSQLSSRRGVDAVLGWLSETDEVYGNWAGHALAVVSVLTAFLFLAVRCGILR